MFYIVILVEIGFIVVQEGDNDNTREDGDKDLIEASCVVLKELQKIVWDVKFVRKIPYFLNFRQVNVLATLVSGNK